jgi:hypothetical protein
MGQSIEYRKTSHHLADLGLSGEPCNQRKQVDVMARYPNVRSTGRFMFHLRTLVE